MRRVDARLNTGGNESARATFLPGTQVRRPAFTLVSVLGRVACATHEGRCSDVRGRHRRDAGLKSESRRITGRRAGRLAGLGGVVEPLDAEDLAVAQRPQVLLVDLDLAPLSRPPARKSCARAPGRPEVLDLPEHAGLGLEGLPQVLHHPLKAVVAAAEPGWTA